MKASENRLAYLLVATPVPNVFIGGMMVVDSRGLPVEFRYTEPIQPTRIQQILYGQVLNHYIKTEVILETLLKSLESRFQVLIVNDENFLFKDMFDKDYDVARVTETKSTPLSEHGQWERLSGAEILLQLTSESSPIRIQLCTGSTDNLEAIGGAKSLSTESSEPVTQFASSKIYKMLTSVGHSMDVLEPLKRVEKALTVLCQEAGIKVAS